MPDPAQSKHAVFSFFSGAGFLDLGFEAAGFEVVFSNEISEEFVEGYIQKRNLIDGQSTPSPLIRTSSLLAMNLQIESRTFNVQEFKGSCYRQQILRAR